jgi:ABC-type nickel/cobalt efflux system permease component RcnA
MKILAAASAATPEPSIHNAIFWLLVWLAVLVAALALKTFFAIWLAEREIRRRRRGEHRHASKAAERVHRPDARNAGRKKTHPHNS